MTVRQDDMNKVADWGEALPEAWYHVRISKVQDKDPTTGGDLLSENKNEPIVKLSLAVQEEPFVGRVIVDFPSLQPQALAKLKAYYTKTGKGILPQGGHDPELLKDGECYVLVQHDTYQGQNRMKISPFGIRSMMEGKPAGK